MLVAAFLGLETYEIWIILIGALVCASCGLLGCFLILKKLSLMGDAISHAVLPGIVLAVILGGKLNSWSVILGAGLLGLMTAFFTDFLKNSRLVYEDASIGIVFTTLFAIGVVLVSNFGKNIDLDPDCVLYGEVAITPFDILILERFPFFPPRTVLGPRSFWVMAAVFLCNIGFISLFYKELKICTFDETLAYIM
jgi:manganese/zinc/iron transport system permease protein